MISTNLGFSIATFDYRMVIHLFGNVGFVLHNGTPTNAEFNGDF